jgi:hypothetical protein
MQTPTTVFWPRNGLTRSEGAVVGWRTSDVVCVVAIVESWVGPQSRLGWQLDTHSQYQVEEHLKTARLLTRRDHIADLEPLGRAALCGGDYDIDKEGIEFLLDSLRKVPVSCRYATHRRPVSYRMNDSAEG